MSPEPSASGDLADVTYQGDEPHQFKEVWWSICCGSCGEKPDHWSHTENEI